MAKKKSVTKKQAGKSSDAPAVDVAHRAGAPIPVMLDQQLPEGEKLSKKEYKRLLRDLQVELLKLQRWALDEGRKVVVIFEGRDAAGKGGTIVRIMQHMEPRHLRKVALAKPTDYERGQWYFQRYVQHLPSGGEIVIFDRSWYNRAGVEPVMGFCTPEQTREFLRSVPQVEMMLVNSGITLVKFWLDVSKEEQHKRFQERKGDPLKEWKYSPLDEAAQSKWDAYTKAKHAMFKATHQPESPWTVVKFDDKRRGQINCIRHLLSLFEYAEKDATVACEPDFAIVGDALNPDFGR